MTMMQESIITRTNVRPKGGAQKDRSIFWTAESRLQGEEHGCSKAHGGAT